MNEITKYLSLAMVILTGNVAAAFLMVKIIEIELFDDYMLVFTLTSVVFVCFLTASFLVRLSLQFASFKSEDKRTNLIKTGLKSFIFSVIFIAIAEFLGEAVLQDNYFKLALNFVLLSYLIRFSEEIIDCCFLSKFKSNECEEYE